MTVKLEKIEKSEAYFEFVIAAEVFDKGLDKAYKKAVKKLDIPGFRKGTAPRAVVEANYGIEAFLEDAMEMVVPDAYYAAVKELGLHIIGEPDIEVGEVVTGQPVNVKVVVPVMPEIKLGQIEGLTVSIPPMNTVSDADIDKFLQNMAAKNKIVTDKLNEPAEVGDTVTFDYKGWVEGSEFEGQEDFKIVIGDGMFIPGFDDYLVGVKQGENREIKMSFEQDHPSKALAGKDAVFNVSIKKVENIKQRELNDEFAREFSNSDSLDELRSETQKHLENMAYQRMEDAKNQAVMNAALAQCEFDVPEYAVMERATARLKEFQSQLDAEGGTIDLYLQMTGSNIDTFKSQMWQEAKDFIRMNFMLDKIAKEKDIVVNDDELNTAIEEFAINNRMDTTNAREMLGPMADQIEYELKIEKTIKYLVDHAVINIEPSAREQMH